MVIKHDGAKLHGFSLNRFMTNDDKTSCIFTCYGKKRKISHTKDTQV